MDSIIANYDEPWKEAISEDFDLFLSFFFPNVYDLIDWNQTPVSLDKELQQITANSDTGKKLADKLFQVWLLDKTEVWVLVHIEVQSQYEKDFAERMYVYNYRAFDLYHKPVISLAVLGDERRSWRPNCYNYNLGGCQINFEFPVVKLLDYLQKWEDLEQSRNPFAIMVMAHLKTKQTNSNLTEREQWKWYLVRSLYEKNYSKKEIVKLFKLIDSMMSLSQELQKKLELKIIDYEESQKMPLLSNMEKRGLEKGTKKTLKDNIVSILKKRFGELPTNLIANISKIDDIPKLQQLHLETISVNSVTEFESLL
jgi:hypothetical protein